MNTLSRLCTVALFAAWAPIAVAQDKPPEPGKTAPPVQREEMKKEVDEAVDAIRGYSVERRDEAVARARQSAEQLDRNIEELEARADARRERMGDAARARSRKAMSDLRQRRTQLAEWTGGMRHGSADAWAEVKTGFVKSYHDLADALRKARTQLDRDERLEAPADDKPSAEKAQEQEG